MGLAELLKHQKKDANKVLAYFERGPALLLFFNLLVKRSGSSLAFYDAWRGHSTRFKRLENCALYGIRYMYLLSGENEK